MSITDQENKLFEDWEKRKRRDDFVRDGVVHERSYDASSPKLMFILKDVNSPGYGGWDFRKELREFKITKGILLNNMRRWATGIRNIKRKIPWEEADVITPEKIKLVKSLCIMNLKKSHGGSTANYNELKKAVEDDKDLIKKQFSFYNADIVICGGSVTGELFRNIITDKEWTTTSRGIQYLEYGKRKYIISYYHPGAHVRANLLYYGIVDAVRELIN